MFVLSQSLQLRIAFFLYTAVLLLLPESLNLLDRSAFSLIVVVLFFHLLPTVPGHDTMVVYGWVMWLDAALSHIMLWAYVFCGALLWFTDASFWSLLASVLLLALGFVATISWYGFKALFADELLRY